MLCSPLHLQSTAFLTKKEEEALFLCDEDQWRRGKYFLRAALLVWKLKFSAKIFVIKLTKTSKGNSSLSGMGNKNL